MRKEKDLNLYGELTRLKTIITTLRDANGCPWDQKQTPLSLIKYLLEESSELAEAIEQLSEQEICDEIGDLFYILFMFIAMYEEKGAFTGADCFKSITEKMIRRHPHVFAGQKVESNEQLRQQWESIKSQEKNNLPPS